MCCVLGIATILVGLMVDTPELVILGVIVALLSLVFYDDFDPTDFPW